MERRKFIKNIGRGFMLSALLALSIFSLTKKTDDSEEACNINPSCDNCSKLRNCEKPQVHKYRKDERREIHKPEGFYQKWRPF